MVGFIKGLFGSKKSEDESVKVAKPEKKAVEKPAKVKPAKAQKPARESKDYFLDFDTARTISNMPKSTSSEFESLLEKGNQPRSESKSSFTPAESRPETPAKPKLEARKPDSSLDDFRKMARDIQKRS
ncbi:MAG: hypothetical protein HC881_17345 [Leptolyngbyaceae cyanobacterium SL_7_1]|nr:hypothetical protein [Leptolyngbyaceae cyanobacterium SL_7_1]